MKQKKPGSAEMSFDENVESQPDSKGEDQPRSEQSASAETQVATVEPPELSEPYATTIACQVARTVPAAASVGSQIRQQLMDDAVLLYTEAAPQDAQESSLMRFIVAATNTGMECFARAASENASPLARETDLKLGIKVSLAVAELVKVLDNHRGQRLRNINVGQVNVQSGGQAVVGNAHQHNDEKATASLPRAPSKRGDQERDHEEE
jgi:hypothetical protein